MEHMHVFSERLSFIYTLCLAKKKPRPHLNNAVVMEIPIFTFL